MAQLVLGIAGAAVGFAIGGPVGAQVGFAAGSMAGAVLFAPKVEPPHVGDLKAPQVQYGTPLYRLYASNRVSGSIAWFSAKRVIPGSDGGGGFLDVLFGGGDPPTADTAEIDILYMLAIDSGETISGIARVWINGELKWTQHADSDATSLAASASTDAWTALRYLDGNAAQLPDPVIEAADGVGNVSAYRHRQCVLIEGLQIGSSGQIPLVEFEVVKGTSGAALTRLESYFYGDDPSDISHYQNGYSLLGTVGGGAFSIDRDNTATPFSGESLTYANDNIAGDGSAVSVEFYCQWVQTPNISYTRMFEYDPNTGASNQRRIGWYGDAGRMVYDDGGFDVQWISAAPVLGRTHVAMVFGATSFRVYVAGTKVYEASGDARPSGAHGQVIIGDPLGYSGGITSYTVDEFAVRFYEQYTADFTPPAHIDPPDGTTLVPGTIDLAAVVRKEWSRCDDLANLDATALEGIPVRGWKSNGAVRAGYEQLAQVFHFDAYTTDKAYCVRKGGTPVETVPFADLAAGIGQATDTPFDPEHANDDEIPQDFILTAPNIDDDYNNGTETGSRGSGQGATTAEVAVVMTASEIKACAQVLAAIRGIEATSGQITLTLAHATLVPTSPILATDEDGTTYRVRIVRDLYDGAVHTLDWVRDDVSVLSAPGITSTDYSPSLTVAAVPDTELLLIDGPILRDADSSAGLYALLKPEDGGTWRGGAALWESIDGTTFSRGDSVGHAATFGTASTALGDWTQGRVFDEINSVTVDVGDATLASSTRDAILNDASVNAFALGAHGRWEYGQFRDAVLQSASPNVYKLTGLLRGSRGTEHLTGTHEADDSFALWGVPGTLRVARSNAQIGATINYKGVAAGRNQATVGAQSLADSAVGLKPFSPIDVRVARDPATGDATLTWQRRSRMGCRLIGTLGVSVPLGEESEAYSIDVFADDTFASVVRVISATTTSAVYTAAQQTADGLTPGDPISVRVYQLSAVVGRGVPAEETA